MGKTQHRCLARLIVSVDVLHGHSRFWTFRCTGKEVKHENRDKPIRSLGWPALTWGDRWKEFNIKTISNMLVVESCRPWTLCLQGIFIKTMSWQFVVTFTTYFFASILHPREPANSQWKPEDKHLISWNNTGSVLIKFVCWILCDSWNLLFIPSLVVEQKGSAH